MWMAIMRLLDRCGLLLGCMHRGRELVHTKGGNARGWSTQVCTSVSGRSYCVLCAVVGMRGSVRVLSKAARVGYGVRITIQSWS